MKNALILLVKTYFKLILGNSRKIHYHKIDLCNIYIKLCKVCVEVKIILEQEIIKLVKLSLSTIKSISSIGSSSSKIKYKTGSLINIKSVSNITEDIS